MGNILDNHVKAYARPSYPSRYASSSVALRDTIIDDGPRNHDRAEKLLKTFDRAYRRAPEFPHVFPLIESVFTRRTMRIVDLAVASLMSVADFLEIGTPLVETSTLYGNGQLKGETRVLTICKAEGAAEYVNPSGGKELYSRDRFEAEGLRLRFVRPKPLA